MASVVIGIEPKSAHNRRLFARARLRVPITLSEPEQVAAFPAD
jgi:hypothetical protein